MSVTVADVLDRSAALLNDVSKTQFTYAVQLPFYNIAQDEIQEYMEQDNVPVTNEDDTSVYVTAGVTAITTATTPALPSDLIEVQQISERLYGSSDDYIPMTRSEFLPPLIEQTESLIWWAWINQELRFLGATTKRQLLINYISARMTVVTSTATVLTTYNIRNFLQYRTAALCAEFIGENSDRAEKLNGFAELSMNRLLSINAKGRQAIKVRRRPFMAAYKIRGY